MMPCTVSGKRRRVARALEMHADELLRVERVAARVRKQSRLDLGRKQNPLEQRADQLRRLFVAERRHRDGGGIQLPASPGRTAVQQLRTCGANNENRDAARPVDQVIDEVEQIVVGPVEVVEDQDERVLLGECFEEAPPGSKALGAAIARHVRACREPYQQPEVKLDPFRLRRIPKDDGDRLRQLLTHVDERVRLEHPGVRLDHLGERPVRDAFAVWKGTPLAPEDEVRFRLDRLEELVDEPALSNPRYADERDELGRALLPRALESAREHVELAAAADQRRSGLQRLHGDSGIGLDGFPHLEGVDFALRLDRCSFPVFDCVAGGAVRAFADENAVHGGSRLQPGRRVDDVSGCHALPGARPRVKGDECLARVDGNPNLKLGVLVPNRVPDRKRSPNRPLGVVLVGNRRAENGHDRVADELLDRPTTPLQFDCGAGRSTGRASLGRPRGPAARLGR